MKKKITNKTKVLIVVHLYGLISNMDEICKLCSENNIILIEDAAQAHGAEWNGRKAGSFGKLSCFVNETCCFRLENEFLCQFNELK